MISGAARGTGGHALGAHLADARHLNEETVLGSSRGLVGGTIREQIAELTDLASHSRAAQPLYHMHADPPEGTAWSEQTWSRYWSLFEREFGLERAAYGEERHIKEGRAHRHRVYSLVREDGTTNPMRHDFARREKLSRTIEHETGAPMVSGAFNRMVHQFLLQDGRHDVARTMEQGGLLHGSRTRAVLTPRERAQAERTGIDCRDVATQALAAWKASDDGRSFRAALLEHGLRIMQGDRVPVLVDQAGGTHPLARLLGKASKAAGEVRIDAAAVDARLAGQRLDPLPEGGRGRRRVFGEQPGKAASAAAVTMARVPADVSKTAFATASLGVDRPRGPALEVGDAVAGPDTDGMDFVRPLDPNRPGDAERFWREMSAAWTRRQQKEAADLARIQQQQRSQGGHHAAQDSILATARHARAGARPVPALVDGPDRRDPLGYAGSQIAPRRGPQGADGSRVRRDEGSGGGGPASAAAAASGAGGGRGGQDSPAPADPGRHGGGAAAAGSQGGRAHRIADRRRIEEVRLQRGLRRLGTADSLHRLTERLRAGPGHAEIEHRVRVMHQRAVLAGLPGHVAVIRIPEAEETSRDADRRHRDRRAILHQPYDSSWLPDAVAADVAYVDVDDARQAVILTLWSGTKIIDQEDRLDIVGTARDIGVGELVEAVRRRGWRQVEIHDDCSPKPVAAKAEASSSLADFGPSTDTGSWTARR